MDGKLEALIALDDWNTALQRIRDVVASAQTYSPAAFRESVGPLWQNTREAQKKLLSAFVTMDKRTTETGKRFEIEDDDGHVIGWQESLINGGRAARVSVIGENVTVALADTENSYTLRDVQLCSSCKHIVEKCPRCEAEAHPSPVCISGETWTEFCCTSCNFRFPGNSKNSLCQKCLSAQERK
jgi:hypothetical protein